MKRCIEAQIVVSSTNNLTKVQVNLLNKYKDTVPNKIFPDRVNKNSFAYFTVLFQLLKK